MRRVAKSSIKTQRMFRIAANILIIGTLLGVSSHVALGDNVSRETEYRDALVPLLRAYCFECHDADSEIPLVNDKSAADLQRNRELWNRALAQVRLGTMPPEDGEMMDAATRKRMTDLIDEISNAVDCVGDPNAGRVALRRLNRAEYRNTVRDLTGVDYEPARGFPGDDVGYGFDNIGDVLSLPPLLMEKYLDAAEFIAGEAIYTPPPPRIYEINKPPSALINAQKFGAGSRLTMASHGTVAFETDLPFAGTFVLTVTASGDQAGDEPAKMRIQCGRNQRVINVPANQATDYTIRFPLAKGKRRFEISFINDYYVPRKADRNLHLHHVHLRGEERRSAPLGEDHLPASHRKLVFVTPNNETSVEEATAAVLGRLASRAFRRPATSDEVARLGALAQRVRGDGGSYEEGIQVALQAILISPHFLFKVEKPRTPDEAGRMPSVDQYELATRISYFLWSSMPDDELLRLAHQGQLRQRKRLLDKIARMLKDPRANRFVENFAGQWLQLRNLDQAKPDTRLYPSYNDNIRQLMLRETLTFFAGVMRANLPVTTLVDADFTYLNEDLAKFYGIEGVAGDEFRRVSLDGTPRGGLLTHASVLTVTSNPTRTSPVKRGKWILDNLLNTPPPPAPPDVPELEKSPLVGTLRERLEQHRGDPACASCHNMMDPLGFALENFDAVGKWRTRDGQEPIDPSGSLPDGTEFNGVDDLRNLLADQRKEEFARALAEKLLIYAVGRGTEYYDKCAIDDIMTYLRNNEYRFAYLIAGIIQSNPFQKQGFRE